MTEPTTSAPEQDPRVYFAAERTFLAWIRTGLGLMGVGFAVSRFSLFLRELTAAQAHLPASSSALPRGSGIALVGLGVLVNLVAALRHVLLIRQLREGSWQAGRISLPAVLLALVLAVGGIVMALYLVLVR
jgi:putative membrane protein